MQPGDRIVVASAPLEARGPDTTGRGQRPAQELVAASQAAANADELVHALAFDWRDTLIQRDSGQSLTLLVIERSDALDEDANAPPEGVADKSSR
jgi:hypothetical protein